MSEPNDANSASLEDLVLPALDGPDDSATLGLGIDEPAGPASTPADEPEATEATPADDADDAGGSTGGASGGGSSSDGEQAWAEAPTAAAAEAQALVPNTLQTLEIGLGIVRVGVGAALVAAPRWAGRIWVGPDADGPGSLVFARAVGARDVVLGLRIIEAARNGEPTGQWIAAGFAADGADAVATLIAARHLAGARKVVMPLIAAAAGVAGFWSQRQASTTA